LSFSLQSGRMKVLPVVARFATVVASSSRM
jgi:hypothetical protein